MATKTTRYIDSTGRIILPVHIRKALNLTEGRCVEIEMDGGEIRIKPIEERCCICGGIVKGKPYTQAITVNGEKKYVCAQCFTALEDAE